VPNQVTLTFAGDTANAEAGFKRVGAASEEMGGKVGQSSKALAEHENGLSRVGGSADNAERNLIGVHDIIDGTATIMQGPGKQGMVAYIQGWADLAGGIAPVAEYLGKAKLATLGQAAAQKAAAVGARIWAAAQWLMNSALLASPLTWIVIGIIAVVAAIVLIATKTRWFQEAWSASWKWIKSAASATWDFIKRIPGWTASAFSRIASVISAPYRFAFNAIARAWNATVGQLSFSVPDWIPGLGGHTFSAPRLPTFHTGGTVPGPVGAPVVALLQGGERVTSTAGSVDGGRIVVGSDGSRLGDLLVDVLRVAMQARGGDPATLGLKVAS
jgi:phage-related protein